MKTYWKTTVEKMARDGRLECQTDLKAGHVEVRWTRTGERETVLVLEKSARQARAESQDGQQRAYLVLSRRQLERMLGTVGGRMEDCLVVEAVLNPAFTSAGRIQVGVETATDAVSGRECRL